MKLICRTLPHILLAGVIAGFVAALPVTLQAADERAPRWDARADVSLSPMELEIWNSPEFKRNFVESYKADTDIEPNVTPDEAEDIQEIRQLMADDEVEKARERLEKEIASNPAASAVYDFFLANIYFQDEQLDEAAEAYKNAIADHEQFRRAYKNLGIINIRQGDFASALENLIRVVELGDHEGQVYGLLGYAHASLGNFISAESAYRMAILLDPKTQDWKMGLARAFFKQERYGEAVALTNILIEENPDQANLWLLQANAYLGLGQPMEAAEIYELLDHMGQSTVESLNILADIYVNEDLYELASNTYIRAMETGEQKDPERTLRSAQILSARGAYAETETLIDGIKRIYGEDLGDERRKELLKIEARLAVAQGSGEKEVEVLEEIVELDPLDGEALILLGQHHSRKGDYEQAIYYFERASNVPDDGHKAQAKVRHAQVLVKQGKYAEALPLLRSAQQIQHRDNVQEYLEEVERVAKSR